MRGPLEFHGLRKEGETCEHCGRCYLQTTTIEGLGDLSLPVNCSPCAELNHKLERANRLIGETRLLLERTNGSKSEAVQNLLKTQQQARNKILNEARRFFETQAGGQNHTLKGEK